MRIFQGELGHILRLKTEKNFANKIPVLLQLGESVQRFLQEAVRNARSPKHSRPPEP
jgi:hypothetical protein